MQACVASSASLDLTHRSTFDPVRCCVPHAQSLGRVIINPVGGFIEVCESVLELKHPMLCTLQTSLNNICGFENIWRLSTRCQVYIVCVENCSLLLFSSNPTQNAPGPVLSPGSQEPDLGDRFPIPIPRTCSSKHRLEWYHIPLKFQWQFPITSKP